MTSGAQSEYYLAGKTAALAGRSALTCPYSTGLQRKEWVAGYFAAKLTSPSRRRKNKSQSDDDAEQPTQP